MPRRRADAPPRPQPLARRNIAANAATISAAGGTATAAPLLWGAPGAVASALAAHPRFAGPDAVVAADVVYHPPLFAPLLATLAELSGGDGATCRVVLAHVRRWKSDSRFFAAARKRFHVIELDEQGREAARESGSAHERGALRFFEFRRQR